LEKTLNGAVTGLWELVQISSPLLAMRSRAIRDVVLWITREMGLDNPWQYELAATLCLMGCITLPDDVFERCYGGEDPSPEEQQMFRAHPETAARLLLKIPRLQVVADMVRHQQDPEARAVVSDSVRTGARMLHLALELDRRLSTGASFDVVLEELNLSPARFDTRMMDVLRNYCPATIESEIRPMLLSDLKVGMVLEKDVCSKDGNLLILKRGTVLTRTFIERLENYARCRGISALVHVRMSSLTGPGKAAGHPYTPGEQPSAHRL
jgi:hypothetical protein